MKPNNDSVQRQNVQPPVNRKRFRIERLEERIAPKKGGSQNCPTANCASVSSGGSGY